MSTSAASFSTARRWPIGLSGLRVWASDHPDVLAVGGLIAATLVVIGNRVSFDGWLYRYDLFTQIIPWYRYLGSQLRAGSVPGWNAHQLSGTPFAGHPLSGWMYLPAMVCFVLFPAITAFKVFVAGHLLLASLSTYAYARVLRWGVVAALVAAVTFAFGPFLEWTTYTSLQFAQFAVWIPLALIGIEVAFQRSGWRSRLLPWCLAAFALSQMLAGWVGEGWIYAGLVLGGYIVYRGFVCVPGRPARWVERCELIGATGLAVLGGGIALGAAGVLPRLSVNAQSSIAGGDYGALGKGADLNPPWAARYLLTQLLGVGDGYHFRAAGVGGAVVVLSLLALVLSPRRFPVPFFAALTAAGLILTLSWTPLHALFYLIPGYRDLHLHDPWRSIGLVSVGPAMLSGAAVQALTEKTWPARSAPVVVAIGSAIAALALLLAPLSGVVQWAPAAAAVGVTLIVLFSVLSRRWNVSLAAALVLIVFLQPMGLELSGSWLGWPHDPRWAVRWEADPARIAALQTELSPTDPNGAGAFLQQQLAADGPFRYLGYGGVGYPDGGWQAHNYMQRRFDPDVLAILVNGRPLALGLDEVQGYDPVQLSRYDDLMRALNEKSQDYHTAFVYPGGLGSPLLNLLDVRYVLVPDSLPPDRPDIAGLIKTSKVVYQGSHVTVYEREPAPAHAWIVHDVRSVPQDTALAAIETGAADPRQTALIEGAAPTLPPMPVSGADAATITISTSDHIRIQTRTDSTAFLVLSEMYADGWSATVDGTGTTIYPTDHALRGVVIPAGSATVDLRYQPRSLLIGQAISALAALVVTIVAIDAACRFAARRRASR